MTMVLYIYKVLVFLTLPPLCSGISLIEYRPTRPTSLCSFHFFHEYYSPSQQYPFPLQTPAHTPFSLYPHPHPMHFTCKLHHITSRAACSSAEHHCHPQEQKTIMSAWFHILSPFPSLHTPPKTLLPRGSPTPPLLLSLLPNPPIHHPPLASPSSLPHLLLLSYLHSPSPPPLRQTQRGLGHCDSHCSLHTDTGSVQPSIKRHYEPLSLVM